MSRLLPILFLVLPFVLFWAYVQFAVGYRERYGRGFYATHWYWVALIALLGCAGSFVAIWAWTDHGSGRYIPPHSENGTIVPGHFEPDQNAAGPQ